MIITERYPSRTTEDAYIEIRPSTEPGFVFEASVDLKEFVSFVLRGNNVEALRDRAERMLSEALTDPNGVRHDGEFWQTVSFTPQPYKRYANAAA